MKLKDIRIGKEVLVNNQLYTVISINKAKSLVECERRSAFSGTDIIFVHISKIEGMI